MSKVRSITVRKDDTRRMEEETLRMEAKLEMLRKTLDSGAHQTASNQDSGRWRSGAAKGPLTKGYAHSVLDASRKQRPQRTSSAGKGDPSATRLAGGTTHPEQGKQAQGHGTFNDILGAGEQKTSSLAPSRDPPTRASANLQAAMTQQSQEAVEVEAFLAGLKLDRYVALFMEQGFDCMEVVTEMQECHMRDIGMAPGHILKLKKRLAEMSPGAGAGGGSMPPSTLGESVNSTRRRVSFGSAEQNSTKGPQNDKPQNHSNTLLGGQFNEEDSAASFQEALKAWRQGNSTETEERKPSPKTGPGSFWSSLGGEEVNLERCSTPTAPPTDGPPAAESETQHGPAPGDDKLCCYHCYKQFFAKFAFERSSPLGDGCVRRLCSEACANKWTASMEAKAEEIQKRHEKLEKMMEMKRALDEEIRVADVTDSPLST